MWTMQLFMIILMAYQSGQLRLCVFVMILQPLLQLIAMCQVPQFII